ncbi:hypothetical protein RND71_025042 [Anisodus tanguticus]|uniref:Peptidase M1 membrane alanine aminopeptidase domain-containing protein n=1 Tax=Anisodus tanguticus TaxID=243964 RepID=A0AAE1RQR3_9SOLA|nr:hypothetical protein RND71_025042 [Anisodus tanguticus]
MAPVDPHSFTDSTQPLTTHISSVTLLSLPTPYTGPFTLSLLCDRPTFPFPDTPAVHVKYTAKLNVPSQLSAIMSARHVERRPRCCLRGELGSREVGPRTRVYAEAAPEVLDATAKEFAGTEEMIQVGEKIFRPYNWERFDLLVLPPSFPFGGMENPRMVFLTPTVIKGDTSGAQVVAHELAHSWTGNLITNKNNDHFWLNEDTPAVRVKYTSKLNVPSQLSAVMAAGHVERSGPFQSEGQGVCEDSVWCGDDRVEEEFVMEQPIPPYLFAFVVGELGSREVGPRTRVYAEAVPEVLDSAAREFAGTEEMIQMGEKLFGPYDWERFDLLVLPSSFPH